MQNRKAIISKPVKAFFVTFGNRPHVSNEIDPHQWSRDRYYDLQDWPEGLEEILEDAEWLSEYDPDIDALVTEYEFRLKQRNRFSGSIPTSTPW